MLSVHCVLDDRRLDFRRDFLYRDVLHLPLIVAAPGDNIPPEPADGETQAAGAWRLKTESRTPQKRLTNVLINLRCGLDPILPKRHQTIV